MKIEELSIPGLLRITLNQSKDNRGSFLKVFNMNDLGRYLGGKNIMQINHSITSEPGSLRGMHYQYGSFSETKIIRCIRGKVFDVVVDLRKNSKTFMKYASVELSETQKDLILVPEGCAHGFQVLEPNSELLYCHTAPYEKSHEGGIRYDDPQIGIKWPMPVVNISERDKRHALLPVDYEGLSN
jgi:dTDP-4-dehydrorhamnose 3,5-epimerase